MNEENKQSKTEGVVAVGSKELLDALFGKYVDADEEVRRIAEESLAANNRFRAAQTARDEAWEKYNTAKKQSASNTVLGNKSATDK